MFNAKSDEEEKAEFEPKPDEQKLRRTLWPIVECFVNREFDRLPAFCELIEGTTTEDFRRAVVDEYPARLILPGDDQLATLVNDDPIPISDTSPQRWFVWGQLYTAEEGRSDLAYWIHITDGDRDRYEASLTAVLVP